MSGAEAPPNSVGIAIDVSKYQSSLPPLGGVLGVIARAGIATKPDPMFADHIAHARSAGKWVGSYWYNWGALSVSDQVDAYIKMEKSVGGVDLHVIDWEGAEGFTASQTAEFIRTYRARTGDPIGLYASQSRFRDLGQDWNWIALYQSQSPPSKHWDMWQYGPYLGVDGNYATQRILNLVKEASDMAALTVTDTTPKNIQRTAAWYNLDGTLASTGHSTGQSYSPYGTTGGFRAFVAGGVIYLNKPSQVVDIADNTQFDQADLDTAAADAAAAQKEADQAEIDAANKAAADAISASDAHAAQAVSDEQARIRGVLGI